MTVCRVRCTTHQPDEPRARGMAAGHREIDTAVVEGAETVHDLPAELPVDDHPDGGVDLGRQAQGLPEGLADGERAERVGTGLEVLASHEAAKMLTHLGQLTPVPGLGPGHQIAQGQDRVGLARGDGRRVLRPSRDRRRARGRVAHLTLIDPLAKPRQETELHLPLPGADHPHRIEVQGIEPIVAGTIRQLVECVVHLREEPFEQIGQPGPEIAPALVQIGRRFGAGGGAWSPGRSTVRKHRQSLHRTLGRRRRRPSRPRSTRVGGHARADTKSPWLGRHRPGVGAAPGRRAKR